MDSLSLPTGDRGGEPRSHKRSKSMVEIPTEEATSTYSSEKGSKETGISKPVGILVADDGGEEGRSSTCESHGLISVIGRRREMEDAVAVVPGVTDGEIGRYDFFAVYDGHGGSTVASACSNRMHKLVAKAVEEGRRRDGGGGLRYWEEVMGFCFESMDKEAMMMMTGGGEVEATVAAETSLKAMGSTAAVVMVGEEEVVVANCGDSRVVLSRGGVAEPLSRDHKLDRPDELARVEAAGGQVVNWNGGNRILGVLSTSRSIGDQHLKPYVISEPEVTVSERSELDEFLVIASDGLWDVVSNEVACEVVSKCFKGQLRGSAAAEAAAVLAELALARGSKDNISVIVVDLLNSP